MINLERRNYFHAIGMNHPSDPNDFTFPVMGEEELEQGKTAFKILAITSLVLAGTAGLISFIRKNK